MSETSRDSILEITDCGAWPGGRVVDNAVFEQQGLFFKGAIPVTDTSIQERIGVKRRRVAPSEERIGVTAFAELLKSPGFDPSRIKVLIGATNFGDTKYEVDPQVGHSFELVKSLCPQALVFDLYAGCPGFNVSVELILMLTLSGYLQKGDLSVIIGAENIHRARGFPETDTSNIIFGDDALATSLESKAALAPQGRYTCTEATALPLTEDPVTRVARAVLELLGKDELDGLIVDNQRAPLESRLPAFAARVQHRVVELLYPRALETGVFERFKDAYMFYREHMNSFAYDINSLSGRPDIAKELAASAVRSGKYRSVVSVFLGDDQTFEAALHQGRDYVFSRPKSGVTDAVTRTHGCFGNYIQGVRTESDVFGEMDGKGVFLYGTRSAPVQLSELLHRNGLSLADVDLLFEHQANFAMVVLTLEQLFKKATATNVKKAVFDFVANNMVNNIHTRGNTSVACMQRMPFDLARGALEPDVIQGYPINQNLEGLRQAGVILYDSVGAGMTRSSFLYLRPDKRG